MDTRTHKGRVAQGGTDTLTGGEAGFVASAAGGTVWLPSRFFRERVVGSVGVAAAATEGPLGSAGPIHSATSAYRHSSGVEPTRAVPTRHTICSDQHNTDGGTDDRVRGTHIPSLLEDSDHVLNSMCG